MSQRASAFASIDPARFPRVGSVEDRFQSYNVEMVEVTGGRFWKPYAAKADGQSPAARSSGVPVGMDPELYQYRPPIDLGNARLRTLASALGPAYVRVSGTWANTVYFKDSDAPPPDAPPVGFGSVLTRRQWQGVVEFADAVDARIVTSVTTGVGVRDADGVWQPGQAQALLDYTRALGGTIAATEFMNEPTFAAMGGAPAGYDAAAFGRDIAAFRSFLTRASPETMFLGPGSVGEGGTAFALGMDMLRADQILEATGPAFDAFSYHFYGGASVRCAELGDQSQTTAEAALSPEWLGRAEMTHDFYADLRDQYLPGAPIWNTETADAACGGNPWASTFLDTFRYVVQRGSLARNGLQVILHNTLASSDYGLLDENTFAPRPNYWATLLWRKLMGTTVLDPGPSPAANLYLFAHSLRGSEGGVALAAVNADRTAPHSLELAVPAERYTLTAATLQDSAVRLNGSELRLGPDDSLPPLSGVAVPAGPLELAPLSITFLAMPTARNDTCR
jgi:heparanase